MRIALMVLCCLFALLSLLCMAMDEAEAARFNVIMCVIFAVMHKMFS